MADAVRPVPNSDNICQVIATLKIASLTKTDKKVRFLHVICFKLDSANYNSFAVFFFVVMGGILSSQGTLVEHSPQAGASPISPSSIPVCFSVSTCVAI